MLVEKGAAPVRRNGQDLAIPGVEARFVLVGDPDPGYPRSISRPRLRAWGQSKKVEWWGCRTDMPEVLASSSLVCFPSHYGEGVPRILVEAAASARAAVTFDAPGCREIVRHGVNGLLVPRGDLAALAEAVKDLLLDKSRRTEMGLRGRALVEERFTQEQIIDQNLQVYRELSPCPEIRYGADRPPGADGFWPTPCFGRPDLVVFSTDPSYSWRDRIAWVLFVITSFQATFYWPPLILVPGERTRLFTALLCGLSLVALFLTEPRGKIRLKSAESLICLALTGLGLAGRF